MTLFMVVYTESADALTGAVPVEEARCCVSEGAYMGCTGGGG